MRGLVTMINPCAVKGISIFLEAAARLPRYEFGVLPGWGTTAADRRALERLPNIALPAQRPGHRRGAGAHPRAADAVAVVRRLRADRDGGHAARHSGGGERFGRAGGGQARHRLRHSGARPSSATSRCSTSTRMPQAGGAGQRCGAVGGGHRASCSTIAEPTQRESAASRAAAGRFVERTGCAATMERFLLAPAAAAPRARRRAATMESLSPEKRALLLERLHRRKVAADAHPAGAELALLSGPRRRRQIQPAADGGAGGARPRVPRGGAHRRLRRSGAAALPGGTGGARRGAAIGGRRRGDVRARRRGSPRGDQRQPARVFRAQVEAFRPEVILASTDDPAQLLLEAALRARDARVVYLARATLALPFGPDCAFPSESKTERLRAADGWWE